MDSRRGVIPREIFCDQAVFAAELTRVFEPSWLFVGHASQLKRPGDFFQSRMGRESVIVTLDRQSQVRVLLNTCRHRGMPVCRYDEGNTAAFTCPYHGWTYATDGKLQGVPRHDTAYGGSIQQEQWGLAQARVELFHGSIWATFNQAAPSLETYLGGMALYLRDLLQGPDGEDDGWEVIEGIMKWQIACNWKLGAENFAGDTYHTTTHLSVDRLGISPSGEKKRHTFAAVKLPVDVVGVAIEGKGHTVRAQVYREQYDYASMYATMPEVDAYYREQHQKRQTRLGDRSRLLNRGGVVFPSMHYNAAGRTTLGLWVPIAPDRVEVWRWLLVPRNAPDCVKDMLRHYYLRYAGPAGLTEQDDMENWTSIQRAIGGTLSRDLPLNYQMGLGNERRGWPVDWLGDDAVVCPGTSENNQRAFYGRWQELMGI
ncbi:MAG: Rieske 2Fe-2S domain-containing protein [Chloroflexi bacterium]|nr:Rieske 2Fe-2S domain-containing protein [Chloroflexota bacterium]